MMLKQIITEDSTEELKTFLSKLGFDIPTLILQKAINGKILAIPGTSKPTFLLNMEKHPKVADDIRYELGDPGVLDVEITALPGKMVLAKVR